MHSDLSDLLRGAKLRRTAPRMAVLQALAEPGTHRDAESIFAFARERLGSLSRQAVYDNLNVLVAAGILRRIEPAGRAALYETRVGDNHHHLVCRGCHATVDVDCAVGAAPCFEPTETYGFRIDESEILFWGLCPMCQTKENNHVQ